MFFAKRYLIPVLFKKTHDCGSPLQRHRPNPLCNQLGALPFQRAKRVFLAYARDTSKTCLPMGLSSITGAKWILCKSLQNFLNPNQAKPPTKGCLIFGGSKPGKNNKKENKWGKKQKKKTDPLIFFRQAEAPGHMLLSLLRHRGQRKVIHLRANALGGLTPTQWGPAGFQETNKAIFFRWLKGGSLGYLLYG